MHGSSVDGPAVERDLTLRIAYADVGGNLWHEAAGQHVLVLVGAGLGESLAPSVQLSHCCLASRLDNTLIERIGSGLGNARLDGLMAVGLGHLDVLPVLVNHLGHGYGAARHSLGGDGGVNVGHGQRRCLNRADCHGRLEGIGRVDIHLVLG